MTASGIVIDTARLRLRPFREDDLGELVRLIGSWEVARWVSNVPHPYADANGRTWIAAVQQEHAAGRPRRFAIALKDTDRMIGGIGLDGDPGDDTAEPALGYWLGQPYWRRGYAREAVAALLDYGFRTLGRSAPTPILPTRPRKKCCGVAGLLMSATSICSGRRATVPAARHCSGSRARPPRPHAKARAQCASGSGRSWNWTTSGLDNVSGVAPGAPGAGASMPSICCGVRLPDVTHSARPFQPAFGSSMRPSSPLAKKPIGYGTRNSTNSPDRKSCNESDWLPVSNGTFAPSPRMLCWSTQT